jgi:hypothetical protein
MFSKLHIARILSIQEKKYKIEIIPQITKSKKIACCLFHLDNSYTYGFLIKEDEKLFFETDNSDFKPEINMEYYIADTYWSNLIELTLSKKIKWKKINFSENGIKDFYTGNNIITYNGNCLDENYVKKQLYHEHCEICMEKLTIDNPIGYYSDPYNYLCMDCWNNYKENRSIDFINWDQDLS